MTMALESDRVTLIGKHGSKMAIAMVKGVAGVLVNEISPSMFRSFDVVVEASGSESGLLLRSTLYVHVVRSS